MVASKLSLLAQKTDTVVYFMKSIKGSDYPIAQKDSADFYRMLTPSTNDPKEMNLYIVQDYYKDMRPKMIGKTHNNRPRLELEGSAIEFFPNGHRKAIRNYADNKLSGNVTEYFPNGGRKSVKNYDTGKPRGSMAEYFPNGNTYITGMYNDSSTLILDECSDSTGKVLARNGYGHYIKYDETFKQILSEGDIENGRENGEWHGVLGDTIKYTCMYVNGVGKNGVSRSVNGKVYVFTRALDEPAYKGGIDAFYKFLANNVHYPKLAKENNVQGKVFLTFVIDKEGALIEIKVVRGIGSGCDEESVRVLQQSPKWRPGKMYGVPVRVQYTMPLSFTLTN